MWKNVVQPDRTQMTIRYGAFLIACWIPKASNRYLEYVIIIAFLLRQWLQEDVSMLHLYVQLLFCSTVNRTHRLSSDQIPASAVRNKKGNTLFVSR
jgi:hypothetical protein